ncbi:glycosyltransferase family 25 protein [Neisseria leonii]|uniref:Glycosyltransferase family 25 protein n=1 Tax=Neisseria leonii TaxID=2995413 RepID=A0A9X4E0Q9_9NEIS|nr:glycosyltransferase family 25 protein [Neisseria sp. 51.81]MDD9326864.1 glycosyltransferase family 25 protein [Neisseria sp. 51.81]
MKNYVISLTGSHERRQHICDEFGKQGIAFEFFDAVTPSQVPLLAKQFGLDIQGVNLTAGELACLLSHLSLWQYCIDNHLEHIAIFEDDIYLGKNAAQLLTQDNWLDAAMDVVKLEFFNPQVRMQKQRLPVHGGRALRKLQQCHVGSAGYILSRQACRDLLAIAKTRQPIPVDHILFEFALDKLNVYQLTPALCVQSDRTSLLPNKQHFQIYTSNLEQDRRARFNQQAALVQSTKPKPTPIYKIRRELMRVLKQILNIKSKISHRVGFR